MEPIHNLVEIHNNALWGILSIPHNIVMNMNNVIYDIYVCQLDRK